MTKSDLKTGMLVKVGEGIVYLVINDSLIGEVDWDLLDNYRENLIVTSKKINPVFKKGLINRINSVRKYTDN